MKRVRLSMALWMLLILLAVNASGAEPELTDMGDGVCRQKNGLMWQGEVSEKFSSGQEAQEYVESLNLGGHSDWRLPTKNELYDLCDIFEVKLEGNCPIVLKGAYWSKNGGVQSGAWEAYPLCGGSEYKYQKKKEGRVRAVRP